MCHIRHACGMSNSWHACRMSNTWHACRMFNNHTLYVLQEGRGARHIVSCKRAPAQDTLCLAEGPRRKTHYVLQEGRGARLSMSCKRAATQDIVCLARGPQRDTKIAGNKRSVHVFRQNQCEKCNFYNEKCNCNFCLWRRPYKKETVFKSMFRHFGLSLVYIVSRSFT